MRAFCVAATPGKDSDTTTGNTMRLIATEEAFAPIEYIREYL